MARVYDWLLGFVNCQPLLAALLPAPQADPTAHLEAMRLEIEKMGNEKDFLDRELLKMRKEYVELTKAGKNAAARVLKQQMAEYVSRCKKIEQRNKLVLGQYNELLHLREDTKMVETSVVTTTLLKRQATEIRQNMRALGGTDGVQTTLEDIADAKQDAADLVGFASRSLLPEDIRATGVVAAPLTIDEELDAYLGELMEDSRPASSVQEAPAPHRDPYAQEGMLVGT